jgi:phosphoserine phosphatase
VQTDLVLQGRVLEDSQIEALASLCAPSGWRRLGPGAARLASVGLDASLADACDRMQLDHAFVPAGKRLSEFGLVAMDMDSTLISIECVDELADLAGIRAQVAQITRSAMLGNIGYAESLARRVALLAGLEASALARVYDERLRLTEGAERLIGELRARGIRTVLVSGGFNYFTDRLRSRLGLDYAYSNEPEILEGRFTGRMVGSILDAAGKAAKLRAVRAELHLAPQQVIAIGDGANDLDLMAEAGVSVAYHAKAAVRQRASYCLDQVGIDGLLNLFL